MLGTKLLTLVASAPAGGDCIAAALRTAPQLRRPAGLSLAAGSRRQHRSAYSGLMARLRKGRGNTARGAARFLGETISRVHYAGATGPLIVRADSSFWAHATVAICRQMKVRYSVTVRQHTQLRNLIKAIPEENWTPIPYWMEGAAAVVETIYTPFASEPDAVPVQLIVQRVKLTPGSQLALFTNYRYHAFITDRDSDTLDLEADHRRHAEIENASAT